MAFSTVAASDNRVYLSTLAGDIYTWDMSSNQFAYQASTGVQLTDIAIAPDGRLFGISYTGLYQIDPQTGQTVYVGPLSSPTQLYYGFSAMTSANGFDISPDGTARVSSGNSVWVFEVDLATGQISAPYAQSLGYRTSAGDIWFIDDTTYAVSTNSYTVEYIAPGSFSEYSVQSDWVGANDLWALFQAPANSTVVAPGTMVGIAASNDTAYNVDAGNFVLGPGLAAFTLGWGQDISGAAAHHGATGSGGGGTGGGGGTTNNFNFTLVNAAKLAYAAYALEDDNPANIAAGNVTNQPAYDVYDELIGTYPTLTPLTAADGFGHMTDRGMYIFKNSGAFVARDGSDVYVSFTGTNSGLLRDDGDSAINKMGKYTTLAGSVLQGFGGVANAAGKVLDALGSALYIPTADFDDKAHWFARGWHWKQFDSLVADLAEYLLENPLVKNLHVTGHSLGAAMVPRLVYEFDDQKYDYLDYLTVDAITFASPGYKVDWDFISFNSADARIANFWTDNDIINLPQAISDAPGDINVLDLDVAPDFFSFDDNILLHSMSTYLKAVEVIESTGMEIEDFTPNGTTFGVSDFGVNINRAILQLTDVNGSISEPLTSQYIDASISALGLKSRNDLPFLVVGTSQSDTIRGEPSTGNVFAALQGSDLIFGSAGVTDVFIFNEGDGNDTIFDYDPKLDVIDARDFARDGTVADVDFFAGSGILGGLLLTFDGNETILIANASIADQPDILVLIDDFLYA